MWGFWKMCGVCCFLMGVGGGVKIVVGYFSVGFVGGGRESKCFVNSFLN